MLEEKEKKKVLARLLRAQGQVGGVARMIEGGTYCVDVLHQLAAVQGALAEVGRTVLRAHLRTCVRSAMRSKKRSDEQRTIDELTELFGRYARLKP